MEEKVYHVGQIAFDLRKSISNFHFQTFIDMTIDKYDIDDIKDGRRSNLIFQLLCSIFIDCIAKIYQKNTIERYDENSLKGSVKLRILWQFYTIIFILIEKGYEHH